MTYTYKLSRRLALSHDTVRVLRPLVLLLLALLATACSTGELIAPKTYQNDRPSPGWVHLSLTTPNGNDGAVQLMVAGPKLDSLRLTAPGGFTSQSGGIGRFILTGKVASGVVARFWVPDTRKASSYVATVVEAAARGTYQLQNLSGYAAQVTQ